MTKDKRLKTKDYMEITVSSPAKINLLGEHAVVYGRPALLTAIDSRIYIKLKTQNSKLKTNVKIINPGHDNLLLLKVIDIFRNAHTIDKFPSIEIEISSQIPVGSGLGSSAALSSALIGALMKFFKNIWNPQKINELTYEAEKIAHGNPSGADNTVVVMGGLIWYRKEFDFLKSIWQLPIKDYKFPRLYIIDSGKPLETTKTMVGAVADFYRKNQEEAEKIFSDQEKLTKELLLSFRNGNFDSMAKAFFLGEKNLEKLGVVGNIAQKIIREIEAQKGVAKISGAGGVKKGSGIILSYHNNPKILINIANKSGFPISSLSIGAQGTRLEN